MSKWDKYKGISQTNANIAKLAEEQGYDVPDHLRKRTDIDSGNWSNSLKGVRPWSPDNLSKLARALGTTATFLRGERRPIPIVAEVSAWEGFPYRENWPEVDIKGYATNYVWEDAATLDEIYALRLKDTSMVNFPEGTIFYAQKNSTGFRNRELVVYCNPDGLAEVRQLELKSGQEQIILRGLNPDIESIPLPRKYLKYLDRVVLISPCGL